MTVQTLTLGRKKYVVLAKSDYERLRRKAGEAEVRPELVDEAAHELRRFRKTGKAADWADVKRRLGL